MILTICPFIKVDPHNLESQNPAKNIPFGLPSSPIKMWGKSVQGFLSYDQTNKQTNRQTEITTLYTLRFLVYKNQWRNSETMNTFQVRNRQYLPHFYLIKYSRAIFAWRVTLFTLTVPLINFK